MTQLRTGSRHPRGWEKVVAQINEAVDSETFHRAMLDLQCKIVAAEYGAIWVQQQGQEPTILTAWPAQLATAQDNVVLRLLKQAAQSGFERGLSHVLKVEAEGETPGQNDTAGAHVFVTVMPVKGKVTAVSTVVAECRDGQVIQTTAPLRELAAGLYEGFASRVEASLRAAETQRIRRAMAILSVCHEGKAFDGSCLNLVNELARQFQCVRVSLGWIKGRSIKLIAMSDTEQLKRHNEQVALVELAMAECLDQQQPIVCPIPDDAEPLLAQAVIHTHKRLAASPNRHVLSIPLRYKEDWVGVLTLERGEHPFDAATIQQLMLLTDTVSPHLQDRFQSSRTLPGHAWESIKTAAAYLVGPRHVVWKLAALGLVLVLLATTVVRWEYRVSSPFVFEARAKRIIPAPYEGKLDRAIAKPGDSVKAGDVLAELDTTELRLQLVESQSKLKMAQLQQSQYLGENKQPEYLQALASAQETAAHIKLLEYQIEKARIASPIDGIVLSGRWDDKVGGVVEQGKPMFEVAPLADMIPLVRVSESDIDEIRVGQKGQLATRSDPQITYNFVVTQVVPLAAPVEGSNVFEVWGQLDNSSPILRPGMEGLAKISAGKRTLAWIATHRLADTLRLWLWW